MRCLQRAHRWLCELFQRWDPASTEAPEHVRNGDVYRIFIP